MGSVLKKRTMIAKMVLLGDAAVGKTTLRRKFMGKNLGASYLPTLGTDFSHTKIEINVHVDLDVQLWDMAGQSSFQNIRHRFLAKTSGVLLVFDLTEAKTLENLPDWIKEMKNANPETGKDIPIMIIGNKVDLTGSRVLDTKKIDVFIRMLEKNEDINFINYIETSAITGINVNKGFKELAKEVYNKFGKINK